MDLPKVWVPPSLSPSHEAKEGLWQVEDLTRGWDPSPTPTLLLPAGRLGGPAGLQRGAAGRGLLGHGRLRATRPTRRLRQGLPGLAVDQVRHRGAVRPPAPSCPLLEPRRHPGVSPPQFGVGWGGEDISQKRRNWRRNAEK